MDVEVQQVLIRGSTQKHRRTDSTGSTNSSRSNQIRDGSSRLSTQRARNRLLESHVAKLFKQKVEIFTKLEYTQESVISTIVKMCLKRFQEYVRLETFSRSGFRQIQLDTQFLRDPLKQVVQDEAVIDFLLDEVCAASAERCLDPFPLEPAILDKLIYAKIAKNSENAARS